MTLWAVLITTVNPTTGFKRKWKLKRRWHIRELAEAKVETLASVGVEAEVVEDFEEQMFIGEK